MSSGTGLKLPQSILVMQRFRVVYRGISHELRLVYTRAFILRLYQEKGLHNYFIICHRKYSGQMERLGVIQLNCTDRWEGSVEY